MAVRRSADIHWAWGRELDDELERAAMYPARALEASLRWCLVVRSSRKSSESCTRWRGSGLLMSPVGEPCRSSSRTRMEQKPEDGVFW